MTDGHVWRTALSEIGQNRIPELGGLVRPLVVLAVLGFLFWPILRESDLLSPAAESDDHQVLVARVVQVLEEGEAELGTGMVARYQHLLLEVEKGPLAGEQISVGDGVVNTLVGEVAFAPGDRVYVDRFPGPEGERYFIRGHVRTSPLLWSLAIFMGVVVLVGRGTGLRSLGGALFGLAVIFGFVVPQILAGRDPILVCVLGALVLLTVSTYLVYGWTPKAHAALVGMAISLALTSLLADQVVSWARLAGLGDEAVTYLVAELGPGIQLRGLFLGGIIIGSLGVLDDICIGQASAAFELARANPALGWLDLAQRTLNVGRDHIAASINTLLLAYVGASLPLMLVFTLYQEPLVQRLNRDPIAEEIVRTLVGSVGLVMAVPITSLVASVLARWWAQRGRRSAA